MNDMLSRRAQKPLTYKQFLLEQPDDITPAEAQRAYDSYRRKHEEEFELAHWFNYSKDTDWMQRSYNPLRQETERQQMKAGCWTRASKLIQLARSRQLFDPRISAFYRGPKDAGQGAPAAASTAASGKPRRTAKMPPQPHQMLPPRQTRPRLLKERRRTQAAARATNAAVRRIGPSFSFAPFLWRCVNRQSNMSFAV